MRILCCGDQHWTHKKPKNRTDDYFRTVLGKLEQEVSIAKEYLCDGIIFPGDLFDSFKEPHIVVEQVLGILKSYNGTIMVVAGQHDQQFHSSQLEGTPLQTLLTAGVCRLLTKDPLPITKGVSVYGASWKDEVPEITTPNNLNILVLHKMIIDEKLWAEQEGHTWANHILMKSKFDLIVSGDNHKRFSTTKGDNHLINCGAMMRSSIAQINHCPAVAIYETERKSFIWKELEIEPIKDIMQVEKAEKEKERNEKLDSFVMSLKTDSEFGINGEVRKKLDFKEALDLYVRSNNVDDAVYNLIKETMQ